MIGTKAEFRQLKRNIKRIVAFTYWNTMMNGVLILWKERSTRWSPRQDSMWGVVGYSIEKPIPLGEIAGEDYCYGPVIRDLASGIIKKEDKG